MLLNNEFAPVLKSSNQMETTQASIEMTPHMFQILSVGIYQHPERACVRELSCNANDGQVAAGNADKPFRVHLPTQLEPYFEVRDFGTGMTHEQVMKLYLTYGASTKRDSNDQIGGLGIGSKSPFAVAQSFNVTSYRDGVVRRYSVYMEEGIPRVTKLTEKETDEPNGVSVRVAVPLDKISKFREEANRIYTHFPVKPECNMPLEGLYDRYSVLSSSPDEFTVYAGNNNNGTIDTSIVMGNIEYPINLAEVIPDYASVIPDFLRRSISKALIYMPIGSVNIAASRESLQLSDSTTAAIKAVFDKVAKEILTKFQAKIDTAKTFYDMVRTYQESVAGSARNAGMMDHLTWQGKSLREWQFEQATCRSTEDIDPATGLPRSDWHGKPKRKYVFANIQYMRIWSLRRNSEKRVEVYSINDESEFSLFENQMKPDTLVNETVFVVDNRLQKNMAKKTAGRAAVLREIANKFFEATGNTDGRLMMFDSEQDIKDLAKLHHYPEDLLRIYKTADYEYAYVAKKAARGQVKLWQCKQGGSVNEVKIGLDDYDDPQYYIRAEGNSLVAPSIRDQTDLNTQLQIMSRVVPTGHVFMFRKTVWDKIPEEWIEIDYSVLEKAVDNNTDWWIELNQRDAAAHASGRHVRLTKLNANLHMQFREKTIYDGSVITLRDGVTIDPRGVNFEDNFDVIRDMFGRPQIIFADSFYDRYNSGLLAALLTLLPDGCKLRARIEKARKRAVQNFVQEKAKASKRYQLLSWIDWDKVTLREVAQYLGHSVTPYVKKL